jgi:DNA-binding CsgD family transcriptional regulator
MAILTEKQKKAADLIAAGLSQKQVGEAVNVSRATVNSWCKGSEFKKEVERRRQRANEVHDRKMDELQAAETEEFYKAIKEYREARVQIYRQKLTRGLKGLKKVAERFDDLPAESIAPNNIAQLLKTFDDMSENAMSGWAELIGIDELLRRLEGDGSKE